MSHGRGSTGRVHGFRLSGLEGQFFDDDLTLINLECTPARVEVAPDGRLTGCLLDATIVSAGHPTLDDPEQTTC